MSLPRVFAGRRRALVAWLVASGAAQAGAALLGARALHEALREPTPGRGALAALAASGVTLAALRVLAAGTAERLGQDYVTRVRLRIFEAVAARPSRAPSPRAGVAMTRVITDLGSLRRWVSDGIARSVVASVTIAAVLGVLAVTHSRAALAFAAIVFGCGVFAGGLAPGLRASVREARRRRGRLANNLGEKLLASRTIRQLGRTQEEAARVRTHSGWLRSELVRRARWAEALVALPALATPLALAAWLAVRAGAESSELAAGVLMLGLIGASLRDLARALEQRVAFGEGRRRIRELLATPRLAEARRARPLAGVGAASIEFADVSVDGALRGVELAAKAGERVLVTGPSGAGKSTLLALAARALDPDEGEILLDGQPLRALALDSVHDAVQLVSPDLPLLRGSVSDNLSYGAGDDDPDWIEAVALACGLVPGAALPDGLGTRVEERGANLSAGLRARVALARAIAMRPRLLLVDDPVFAVDQGAREALIRSLELHPTTALVVAPEGELARGLGQVWRLAPSDSPASSPSLEALAPAEDGAPADAHSDA